MKTVFLTLAAFASSGCSLSSSASQNANTVEIVVAQTNTNSDNDNRIEVTVGNFTPLSEVEKAEIEEKKRKAKEKLESVPDDFKRFDFNNFKFPANLSVSVVPLKDGSYEYEYPHSGGKTYELRDVYYADLTNDGKKEAIVNLFVVSCGGSCDGGANIFYVYATERNKLKLLWHFETGSLSGGEGLKSFRVENNKITVEEFGKCSAEEEKASFQCTNKFSAKNIIRLTFSYNGKKIFQKSKEIIDTQPSNVMGYRAEISIN